MKKVFIVILLFFAAGLCAQDITLSVPDFPPLTEYKNGKFTGVAYDLVVKIMREAKVNAAYKHVSTYPAALNEMKTGVCDGFSSAAKTAERDESGVRTNPMLVQRWIWVFPKDSKLSPASSDFKSKVNVGVLFKQAQQNFLKDNGYKIAGTPTTPQSLITMLENKRFDVVLTNELVWDRAFKEMGKKPNDFKKVTERTTTDGIYISKATLLKYPDLMNKLNAAIKKVCGNLQQ